jgi:hypothetical protein
MCSCYIVHGVWVGGWHVSCVVHGWYTHAGFRHRVLICGTHPLWHSSCRAASRPLSLSLSPLPLFRIRGAFHAYAHACTYTRDVASLQQPVPPSCSCVCIPFSFPLGYADASLPSVRIPSAIRGVTASFGWVRARETDENRAGMCKKGEESLSNLYRGLCTLWFRVSWHRWIFIAACARCKYQFLASAFINDNNLLAYCSALNQGSEMIQDCRDGFEWGKRSNDPRMSRDMRDFHLDNAMPVFMQRCRENERKHTHALE